MSYETTNLIAGFRSFPGTSGGGAPGDYLDVGGTTPSVNTGDLVSVWVPLAGGTTCGTGTGACTLHLNDFGTGASGVRSGAGSNTIAIPSHPAVGPDFDLFCAFMILVKNGFASRVLDMGVGTGLWFGEGSAANKIGGGYCQNATFFDIDAADGVPHIIHLRKNASENSG